MDINITPKTVIVIPYQEQWPRLYMEEAEKIKIALGDNCEEIHHIGSTSIPGLSAKPIIDILPVVTDIGKVTLDLVALGYHYQEENRIPFRIRFEKSDNRGVEFKVMIFEKDNPEVARLISFRDLLRQDPQLASEYANLKVQLATQFPNDLDSYTKGKSAFIQKVDAITGTDQPRIIFDLGPPLTARCHELLGPSAVSSENCQFFLLIQALRILAVARFSLIDGNGKIETAVDQGEEHHKEHLERLVQRWAHIKSTQDNIHGKK